MTDKLTAQDEHTLAKAAALMAANPSMKATAALRKLGLRSEPRIGRLRRALTAKAKSSIQKKRTTTREHRGQPLPVRAHEPANVMKETVEPRPSQSSSWPMHQLMLAQFDLWKTMWRWTPLGMMLENVNVKR